ncbi:hypothetical protein Tco_0924030 [Tanacetum coccineum]|uniref:Reverse transcriptase domain-containing protein n=1 Tax=Tanacetum coccineum TaxID=301880 RepID=A0ABQ5D2R2_9ASTR
MPLAYHVSTSANLDPMINLAFVEANYKVLESLLRERMRQMRNKDLRTKLEYFSEEYVKESEMEPRPTRIRETTPVLPTESLRMEDYPLPDGLKMPSHVGSYDEKGDSKNYLNLFEGAIRSILNYEDLKAKFWSHFSQQKKFTKTHLAVYNIKKKEGESTRAFVRFVHGLKTRSLMEFLSTDLPTTYKGLMEITYTWIKAREVATNKTMNDHRESFDRFKKKSSWDNNKGKKNRDRFSPYRGSNHKLLSNLSKIPKEILATEKVAKTFEQPPRLIGCRRSRGMSKYCRFHEDYGHDTNQCRELKHQIEEAIKSRHLAHLVKGIKRESSCEVIYEHYFLKLKPSIKSLRVDSKVPLIGFSREHSWPLGEVPLEIIIGESPLAKTKVLNFVILSSDSLHNLLLRRNAMQRMGIVVSIIHRAIKFYTPRGVGNVFSTYEPDKIEEGQKKLKEASQEVKKGIIRCVDVKERVVVNDKYPEQTIFIGK